jgi:hypothetical protein
MVNIGKSVHPNTSLQIGGIVLVRFLDKGETTDYSLNSSAMKGYLPNIPFLVLCSTIPCMLTVSLQIFYTVNKPFYPENHVRP